MEATKPKFTIVKSSQLNALPQTAGVYAFKPKKAVLLYIGKAINIRERVKNHFSQPTFKDNIFIPETEKIGFIATSSEIEALLLEADLIKKLQPRYNVDWKDNKNYSFAVITKENFPRIFITHQLQTAKHKLQTIIGPFIDGKALKQTLRVLRRVFPYRTCNKMPKKPCLYKELDLCLAPCEKQNYELRITNYEFKKNYSKNIKNLVAVLQGKKTQVLKDLQKEMKLASQKMAFEKAKVLRDQIWALENVFSHSHIFQKEVPKPIDWQKTEKQLKKILYAKSAIAQSTSKYQIQRIEGYDISNIQGQQATGSMVVFENGIPNKNEYRKFKIKITDKPNDTAMLKETISRRLKHKEWPMPQVMLIDGGIGQLNTALKLKTENEKLKNIKIISLAKRKNELFIECQQTPVLLKNLPQEIANLILHLRDESHRFAIAYHKKLRTSSLFLNHKS